MGRAFISRQGTESYARWARGMVAHPDPVEELSMRRRLTATIVALAAAGEVAALCRLTTVGARALNASYGSTGPSSVTGGRFTVTTNSGRGAESRKSGFTQAPSARCG